MRLTSFRGSSIKAKSMVRETRSEGEITGLEAVARRLRQIVDFVLRHRFLVVLGVVIALGCGLGFWLFERYKGKKEEVALLLLGRALEAQRVEERLSLLKELERFKGTKSFEIARLYKARGLLEVGNFTQAEEELSAALNRLSSKTLKAQAHCLLGDALTQQGKWQEAIESYRRCQKEGRGWLDTYALLKEALLLDARGQKREAIQAYEKLLPLLPQGEMELFVRLRLERLTASGGT